MRKIWNTRDINNAIVWIENGPLFCNREKPNTLHVDSSIFELAGSNMLSRIRGT